LMASTGPPSGRDADAAVLAINQNFTSLDPATGPYTPPWPAPVYVCRL